MANVYSPESLGIKPPSGGFQEGGWYSGRQYWGGTLSDPGVIHPSSSQTGAGQAVSAEVNKASAAAQGVPYTEFASYLQQQREQSAAVTPAASYTPGAGMTSAPSLATAGAETGTVLPAMTETLNLPEMYKSLYQEAGISEIESKYSEMEREFINAKAEINDNPFLSEATRVGRIAKIEQLFNERTANIKDEIATKKADVETQLNLQLKQFDITSQAARDALDRFNVLLQLGALDNATGEDIANLTRMTGISSNMIFSAIQTNKAKNVNTQLITSTAENGEVWAVVLNSDTGQIISRQSLGVIGNVQGTGTGFDTGAFTSEQLLGDQVSTPVLSQVIDEVIAPSFSPAMGVGSAYTDALGRNWTFGSSGWEMLEG